MINTINGIKLDLIAIKDFLLHIKDLICIKIVSAEALVAKAEDMFITDEQKVAMFFKSSKTAVIEVTPVLATPVVQIVEPSINTEISPVIDNSGIVTPKE